MKSSKFLAGLTCAAMAMSLCACSGSSDSAASSESASESSSSQESTILYRGSNYARIVNPELNQQLIDAKATDDEAVSIDHYKKAMVLESELAPYLPIYGNNLFNIYSKDVSGIHPGPVCHWSQSLADAKVEGGKDLIVGTTQEMKGVFNPLYYTTAYDGWVIDMIYQGMLSYDADSNLQTELAAEMPTWNEDGTVLTFKLKEGLKFSDGSDLNANDVKFTFTLLADPEYVGQRNDGIFNFIEGWDAYQSGDAEEVSGIKVVDDYTIEFTMATPNIDALTSIGTFAILPDDEFEYTKGSMGGYSQNLSGDAADDMPIGSGPYVLNSYDKSAGASLVKNENFSGEGAYSIERIIVKTIATATELASLQNGDINYLPDNIDPSIIGPASLDDSLATDHFFRAAEGYMGFNCADGATADQAVRQALSYATDRKSFVEAYFKYPEASEEVSKISVGYVPTVFWNPVGQGMGVYSTGEEELDGLVNYDYDLEKAKQILDDAGWKEGSTTNSQGVPIREKDGQKLEVKFIASEGNSVLDMLLPMIIKSWGDLGVDLKQTSVDFNTMADTVDVSNEDVTGWNCFFMAASFNGLSNTDMNESLGYQGELEGEQSSAASDDSASQAESTQSEEASESAAD